MIPMTIEIKLLLWATLFGLLQCLMTGFATTAARGMSFSAGARDAEQPLPGWPGRVVRAFRNFMETFPVFATLVILSAMLHRQSLPVALGAQAYFWARLIYWPLYVAGVPMVRSLAWVVSFAGLLLMLLGLAL